MAELAPQSQPPEPRATQARRTALDYVGLGLLLMPPSVLGEMYIKGEPIDWRRAAIAAGASWVGGMVVLHFSKPPHEAARNATPTVRVSEYGRPLWARVTIVIVIMAATLAMSSLLSPDYRRQLQEARKNAAAMTRVLADMQHQLADARQQLIQAEAAESDRPNGRNVLDIDLVALREKVSKGTALEAAGIVAPYVGQWINLSGTVRDIEPEDKSLKSFRVFIYYRPDERAYPAEKVSILFKEQWKQRLMVLSAGQSISAICQIIAGSGTSAFYLENCEHLTVGNRQP